MRSRRSRHRRRSGGGIRWRRSDRSSRPTGFDEAVAWLEANDEKWNWSGYLFSKWVVDAWVGHWYPDLAAKGIRINCINPGPTDTAMMPAFQDFATKEVVDQAVGPIGRYARPEEQAWPLVMLGSPRCSYVAGEVLRGRRRLPGRPLHRPTAGRLGRPDRRRLTRRPLIDHATDELTRGSRSGLRE